MEKNKTAVEWLIEEQSKAFVEHNVGRITLSQYINLMADKEKKAKEMDKEQKINAHLAGQRFASDNDNPDSEEYYTQTYGGEQ